MTSISSGKTPCPPDKARPVVGGGRRDAARAADFTYVHASAGIVCFACVSGHVPQTGGSSADGKVHAHTYVWRFVDVSIEVEVVPGSKTELGMSRRYHKV